MLGSRSVSLRKRSAQCSASSIHPPPGFKTHLRCLTPPPPLSLPPPLPLPPPPPPPRTRIPPGTHGTRIDKVQTLNIYLPDDFTLAATVVALALLLDFVASNNHVAVLVPPAAALALPWRLHACVCVG